MASPVATRIVTLGRNSVVSRTLAIAYEAGEVSDAMRELFEHGTDARVARVLSGVRETMNVKDHTGKNMRGGASRFIPAVRAHCEAWMNDLAA